MAVLTRTYTKTYALMDEWASTLPWDCDNPTHDHDPMINDPCRAPGCDELLLAREECYAVVELPGVISPPAQNPRGRVRHREQWVCWRHVRPDDGPIKVEKLGGSA